MREVLIGRAKKLVSQPLTNTIDEAWDVLKKAFGDPIGLINNRKDSLLKLPPELADEEDELVSIIRAKGITELDLQEVSLHALHSSKKLRGRLVTSTEVLSGSSVEERKRGMFYKASVFDPPEKFKSGKFGKRKLRNIQARKGKSKIPKDNSKLKMFQVYLPDVKEAKELFDDKKPPDRESDNEVVDVQRHGLTYMEVGVYEESGCEKNVESLFRDDQEALQFNKPDLLGKIAAGNEWFMKADVLGNILNLEDDGDEVSAIRSDAQRRQLAGIVSTDYCLHAGDQIAKEVLVYYYDAYYHCGGIGQLSIIAGEIQANGEYQLYDGHVHSFTAGHPRYVAMSVDMRLEVAMLAVLCIAKEPGTVNEAIEYEAEDVNVKEEKFARAASPEKLKLQRKQMMTDPEGEETVQVKEVKSDFESPGTDPIVANSDQKSLFPNQAMEKLKKKMNADDRILFSRNTIMKDLMFPIVGGMEDKILLGEFGINFKITVFDHSPFSYTVGNYVHRIIFKHSCHETCLKDFLYVCFSQGFTIQGITLLQELSQDCIRCIKIWRVIVQPKNSYKKKVRLTDRSASSLVELFINLVTTLFDNMNTLEKVPDALKKDEVEDELVNKVEHVVAISQKKLQHREVFQHPPVTKIAKKGIIKTGKNGCCVSHRKVAKNGPKAVSVVVKHYSHGNDNLFDNMLDRSWLGLDEFEDEMRHPVNKDNTIFLIWSVTLELVVEYEEEMCSLAKKDNTLLFLMCSVNLDLTAVVMEDL